MTDTDLLKQAIKRVKWDTKPNEKTYGFSSWTWEDKDVEDVCKIYGDLKSKKERTKILDMLDKFIEKYDNYSDIPNPIKFGIRFNVEELKKSLGEKT